MNRANPDSNGPAWEYIPRQSLPAGMDLARLTHDTVIVGQDGITQLTKALRQSSHRDWMLVHGHQVPPADWDAFNVPAAPGIRVRAVYDERFADDPAGLRLIRDRAAMGEQARLHPRVPFGFRVADSDAALLLMPDQNGECAMLLRDQPSPATYRGRFELLWNTAEPLGDSAGTAAFRNPRWLN